MFYDECIFKMDSDYEEQITYSININHNYNQFKNDQSKKETILSKSPTVSHIQIIPPPSTSYKKKLFHLLKKNKLQFK
tara:strand:+ start:48 stop:281 length:234 start_codon:yes stop_codon:yes gene_type:complete